MLDFTAIFLALFFMFSNVLLEGAALVGIVCVFFMCRRQKQGLSLFFFVIAAAFLFAIGTIVSALLRLLSLLEDPVFLLVFNSVSFYKDSRCL